MIQKKSRTTAIKKVKVTFFLFCFIFFAGKVFSQTGSISGKVFRSDSREALPGAYISITHTSFKKACNNEGEFQIIGIPAGEYDIIFENVGYATITKHVAVKGNETLQLNIGLSEKTKALEEVYVFNSLNKEEETGARKKEKTANNLVNIISARAIEVSPDINAANVLQRMSGLTIQRNGGGDEAYAIIRGLDPRYNNTLINGIKIASPDEKSRFVPLSIVPADLLGSIEVYKSLLPDMEADAIGGTVNMVMKDAPQQKVFKVLGSFGYSKIFLDRKFENFSKADIQRKSLIEKKGPDYTAQPDDFSRTNLDFKSITPLPNTVLGIIFGQRFLKDKLGFMVSENLQNQYYGSNSVFNRAAPNVHTNQPGLSDYANRSFSTQQLNNGLVLHLDYKFDERNKITLTNISLFSFLAQARTIVDTAIIGGNGGRTVPGTGPVYTNYTSLTSRQLVENVKLEGKHILSKHFLFDWAGVFSYASKRTPDFANISVNKKIDTIHTTNDIHGPYTFVTTPDYFDDISRIWQHNEDKDLDALGNITYRTRLGEKNRISLELKAGGLYRHKTRYNIQDTYRLLPTASSSGIKQIYTGIYTSQWTVYNSHGTFDYDKNNYRLFEDITAGYGEFKISLPYLDIVGGARMEQTSQGYTLNTFHTSEINGLTKNYTDLLPSGMIKLKLNEKTNIRAAYFKSISRPNYYELVPAEISSLSDATSTTGNSSLKHAIADNYDLRYEFYPKGEEQFFAGVFYKKLQNPIEYAYISGTTFTPQNFGTATIYGAELSFTKYFGNIGITGNYTYLYSKIYSTKSYTDLIRGVTFDSLQKRPMQGQTDHTLNLSLLYKNEKRKLFAQLAFEYIGKTLALVYPVYGYDYYQQPQSILSFSAEKQLSKHFTLFTKLNNLLNTHTRQQINNLLLVDETTKFNFSLGIRYAN